MIINMWGLFNYDIVHKPDPKNKDPYSVRSWARYFRITTHDLIASYSFYLLQVLKKRVAFSVETQTMDGVSMKSIFKQLNPNYKKRNQKNKDKFWYDTEFLISSMRVWQSTYNGKQRINLGIPKDIKHPTSGTPAFLIFKYLEFGTRTKSGKRAIPPRPIITPHLRFILKNTDTYFFYFIKLCVDGKIKLKKSHRVGEDEALDIVKSYNK